VTVLDRRPAAIGVGIVGCGRAATSLHVPALERLSGAAVVALSDHDTERLDRLAARCHGASRYPDYDRLLADPRVDLVAVCVPVTLHEPVARAAIRAAKHVFIEKPLAMTLDECDRLVEDSSRGASHGVRSAVGFNLRSHRLVRQAKALVQSGRLGEVEMLRTLWTADWSSGVRPPWHHLRSRGGGALLEIGTHQADLWRYLLDAEVESIHALARSEAFDDQSAVVEARMTNGVLVSTALSQSTTTHNTIEIFGTRGSLRLSCYHGDSLQVTATGGGAGAWRRISPLLAHAARLPGALRAARKGGEFKLSYQHQWERIVKALHDGGPMPASVEDGREAARVVLAALSSSQDGSAVRLGPSLPTT
jgi:predicted dehydrogenase